MGVEHSGHNLVIGPGLVSILPASNKINAQIIYAYIKQTMFCYPPL